MKNSVSVLPNPKSQIPNPKKIPNSKSQPEGWGESRWLPSSFPCWLRNGQMAVWSLSFGIFLGFGVWDLGFIACSCAAAGTNESIAATNRVDSVEQRRGGGGRFGGPERGVYKAQITPHWFQNDKQFWYRNDLRDGAKEFIVVDAEKGIRQPAFDHEKLAAALSKSSGEKVSANKLPSSSIEFFDDGKTLEFEIAGKTWR